MTNLADRIDAYRESLDTLGGKFNKESGACPAAGSPEASAGQRLVNEADKKIGAIDATAVRINPEYRETVREGNRVAEHLRSQCSIKPGKPA